MGSDDLRAAKLRLLERVALGVALAALAGYAALAAAILRREPRREKAA